MCIYCETGNYRKIYETHVGPIPKDENGRTFEIHHIDGDNKNNTIANLKCVSINEHYDIHHSQGDWNACSAMAIRMNKSREEISELTRLHNLELSKKGQHPFQKRIDGSSVASDRVNNGTHPLLTRLDGSSVSKDTQMLKVANGTHHFLGGKIQKESNLRRARTGTDPFHDKEKNRQRALKRVKAGTHPSQIMKECEQCGESVNLLAHGRWHGDKCRNKPEA